MSEYVSMNLGLDWHKAKKMTAGVDIGATSSKVIILADGEPYIYSQVKTIIPGESALRAMNTALGNTDLKLENINNIISTGCGRKQVPYAHKSASEIVCGAAGAVQIYGPTVRTVLDLGGQNCRVIHVTPTGRVTTFFWNDKCAAGIGRSLETFADLVNKEVGEMGNIALNSKKAAQFSDFCAVYSQSEAIDALIEKKPLEEIIAGFHKAMAIRISTLVFRTGLKEELAIVGGLAKNKGLVAALEGKLNMNKVEPQTEWDPAFTVALGAALLAAG
jgi:predicted CoA-substrate-specific enzyme activase